MYLPVPGFELTSSEFYFKCNPQTLFFRVGIIPLTPITEQHFMLHSMLKYFLILLMEESKEKYHVCMFADNFLICSDL